MTTTYDLYEIPIDAIVHPDSSFVDTVAYDLDGQICYVVLHGDGYAYTGVPYDAFLELFGADSVGHQYHEFSKQYGPGTYLNVGWDFVIREEPVKDSVTESDDEAVDENLPDFAYEDEDLESDDYDEGLTRRVWALQNAAVVYQGRKTRGGEVINLAKRFEEYLNGS